MFFLLVNATGPTGATGNVVEDEGSPAIVSAQQATASGVASIAVFTTGAGFVTAGPATSTGTADLIAPVHDITATVTAQTALVSGSGSINAGTSPVIVVATGSPQAGAATSSGVLALVGNIVASVQAQDATVDATATVSSEVVDIDAEVFAQDATVTANINDGLWITVRVRESDWIRIYPNG